MRAQRSLSLKNNNINLRPVAFHSDLQSASHVASMPAWVAYGRAAAAPRLLRWRCRRLAAACPVRLVGDIRHAEAVFHKVFGQENKPGAPVTSSQGARDTNVRPPNRAWEERSTPQNWRQASQAPTRGPRLLPDQNHPLDICGRLRHCLRPHFAYFPAGASSCPTRRSRARA